MPTRKQANPWAIALTVTLACFMETLDSTIVNVALPHIAGSMSATTEESTWTLTSYLVSNGIVLTISGSLTKLLGRKRYFLICIGMFTLCSLLCGLSGSLGQLIVFRLLQGFFGGGLQPNQQSIILDTFPPAKRAQAFGLTAMATVVGPIIGPLVGGWITDHYSWRWIFLINIPVGIATFLGVMSLVSDPPHARPARASVARFDFVGLGLIVVGLGAFQIMLDRGADADWFAAAAIRVLAVLAAIGIVGAIVWLLRAPNPVVNLRVLADRNFAVGCVSMAGMALLLYSSAVLLPQLSENQFGYTATLAGEILMPGAIMLIALIVLVSRVIGRIQTRFVVAIGFVCMGVGFTYSHGLAPDADFWTLIRMRILQTFGLGFLFVPISIAAYKTIPEHLNHDAASLFSMFRNIAGSIGISVSNSLLTLRGQTHMALLGAHQTPYAQPYLDTLSVTQNALQAGGLASQAAQQSALTRLYRELIDQAQFLAYLDVFSICALLAFCMAPFALLFSPFKASMAQKPS